MKTREIELACLLAAATVAVALAKGLTVSSLPGLVEFLTVLIFTSGFCFGPIIGCGLGLLSLILYMLVPFPLAQPAAWLFVIPPVILGIMGALGAMFGIAGGFVGRRKGSETGRRLLVEIGLSGFLLTLTYDVGSSVAFWIAYRATDFSTAVLNTFTPALYPYPPIVHTLTNTVVFLVIAPPVINRIEDFKLRKPSGEQISEEKNP